MNNFEEEVQYFMELVYNNIQEARKRKKGSNEAEEAILNCISISKDGQSLFVYNMDKDYCYELLKKDIEEYNYKNYRTKALALYYIGRLLEYLKKEITFEELAGIYEETKPVVKNIIQQKDNIMDQLKLLHKNRNIPEVQEYIDKLYNGKYASKYLKYLIDKYYYDKKKLIRPKKNGLETEFKMLLHWKDNEICVSKEEY